MIPDSTINHFGFKTIYAYPLDDIVLIVALALGFMIILIGYFFAGGKYNQTKLIFSIIISSGVGILVLPGMYKIASILNLTGEIVNTAIIIIDLIFVAVVSCHAYEIVTVTAREAHPT